MHVVAFNGRDLQNPRAGGAEVHLPLIERVLAEGRVGALAEKRA